jgi:hypothetical protein
MIDKEGNLLKAYIPSPSAFHDMDEIILKVCRRYTRWHPGKLRGLPANFTLNCNFFITAGKVTGYQQTY